MDKIGGGSRTQDVQEMRNERIRWQKIKQEMGAAKNLAEQVRNQDEHVI